jgi:hypothetical protein
VCSFCKWWDMLNCNGKHSHSLKMQWILAISYNLCSLFSVGVYSILVSFLGSLSIWGMLKCNPTTILCFGRCIYSLCFHVKLHAMLLHFYVLVGTFYSLSKMLEVLFINPNSLVVVGWIHLDMLDKYILAFI